MNEVRRRVVYEEHLTYRHDKSAIFNNSLSMHPSLFFSQLLFTPLGIEIENSNATFLLYSSKCSDFDVKKIS